MSYKYTHCLLLDDNRMDKLNSMTIFTSVVENEGFSAAAVKLGLSRAQVSKAVAQLESYLGIRLLNRTTRHTSLTESGKIYYERTQTILDEINEIESIASNANQQPRGRLTISAPTSFGILQLQKAIPDYLKKYPDVQISLSLADRFIDVVSEGYDLVIRITALEDSSLIAKKLAPCKRVLCASPDYLQQHGEPKVPQDLATHHCLVYSNELKPDNWTLTGPTGAEKVKVNGPVCADNGDVLKATALSGLGIALLPTFIVGDALQSGELKQILKDYCPPDISIYSVFPSRRYLSVKVRTFIDFLTTYYGDNPQWDDY